MRQSPLVTLLPSVAGQLGLVMGWGHLHLIFYFFFLLFFFFSCRFIELALQICQIGPKMPDFGQTEQKRPDGLHSSYAKMPKLCQIYAKLMPNYAKMPDSCQISPKMPNFGQTVHIRPDVRNFGSCQNAKFMPNLCQIMPKCQIHAILGPKCQIVAKQSKLGPMCEIWDCAKMPNYAKLCQIMPNYAKLCQIMPNYAKMPDSCQIRRPQEEMEFVYDWDTL